MAIQDKICIGDIFERLTVTAQPYRIGKRWYTDCKCFCGNQKSQVRIDSLVSKRIRSCGCLARENGKKQCLKKKRFNRYEFHMEYGIGFTSNTNQYGENFFLFDLEDFVKIKDYCWCFDKDGYVFSMSNDGRNIKMHRLVMDCPDGLEVDHMYYENGKSSKNDNRKENLKICTHRENCNNRLDKTTGIINTRKGYEVYKKSFLIGVFSNYEEALKAKNN